MAYSDHRRDTVGHLIEQVKAGQHCVVYLREEEGRLVETRKVTNLVRCVILDFINLNERRGYKITVMTPDGTERIWGAWEYNEQRMGVQGASTVWIEHPKPNSVPKTIDERLDALASAVFHGASNPPLIKRANRIADDLQAEYPAIADELRHVLTTRWESLGNRHQHLQSIRLRLRAAQPALPTPVDPEPQPEPVKPSYEELEARLAELQAEVTRLTTKYETPCPGLARNAQGDVVSCGGFLGHPGDCAEVW
jgi:hypothetical protein